MDLQNMDLKGGSLQISTEVIGKIARCAALEVDGVSEVSCGKQNKKVKELLAAASIQPPVTVEMRDGTAELTLNLVVKFGAKIPAVAEKVQENVKSAVQNMTNVTVQFLLAGSKTTRPSRSIFGNGTMIRNSFTFGIPKRHTYTRIRNAAGTIHL